jgi:hypothetical protein
MNEPGTIIPDNIPGARCERITNAQRQERLFA